MNPQFYYDEILKKVSCYSYVDFIKTLNILAVKKPIDANKTLNAPRWMIVHEDGTSTHFIAWYNLFNVLDSVYGLDIDHKRSFVNLQTHVLVFNSEPTCLTMKEAFKNEEKELETVGVLTDEVDDKSSEDESQVLVVDFEELLSLKDDKKKRASKDALHKAVLTKYDINLNKGVVFDEMIDELRAIVGA